MWPHAEAQSTQRRGDVDGFHVEQCVGRIAREAVCVKSHAKAQSSQREGKYSIENTVKIKKIQRTQRKNLRALCASACDSYCQDVAFRVRWLGIGRIVLVSLLCA